MVYSNEVALFSCYFNSLFIRRNILDLKTVQLNSEVRFIKTDDFIGRTELYNPGVIFCNNTRISTLLMTSGNLQLKIFR